MLEPVPLEQIRAFAVSLAIGLLIGLERERKPGARAGLRTFALTSLAGTLTAMLSQQSGSVLPLVAGLLVVGANFIIANAIHPDLKDPGTTSVAAALVCFCLGAVVWHGYVRIASMLAISTTVLLYFKAELHGITTRLKPKDWISVLQFAVLALVILPLLPDQGYGPFEALNPYQVWWMVVLISGVSIAGYVALRLAGEAHGTAVIGIFGGLASSTATTLIFSRHARADQAMVRTATTIIMLANLVLLVRLCIIGWMLVPELLPVLVEILGSGFLLGLVAVSIHRLRNGHETGMTVPEMQNPAELKTALSFGALYAVVLFCVAGLMNVVGNSGVFVVALVSGLTDVDAITLSGFRLFSLGKLTAEDAALTAGIAVLSNLVFKSGLAMSIGGRELARSIAPTMLAVAAGVALAMAKVTFF